MQNRSESYMNDEHIYDSIYDVDQKNYRLHATNINYRTSHCTSFMKNDNHVQKSTILSNASIENGWQTYWEWCSACFLMIDIL